MYYRLPTHKTEYYRGAMIFFLSLWYIHNILNIPNSSFVSINDLMATVASYFYMNTGSMEREAKRAIESIHHAFLNIGNLQGIGFLNSVKRSIFISDLDTRLVDIIFLTFCSSITASDINIRLLYKSLSIDFSLRLP